MDDEWKEWDVVEDMRKMKVPGFMFDSASSAFDVDRIKARIQRKWGWFVKLLNTNGDGTGYERLLTLQDNMEARKETLSRRLEKWEDRREWLKLLSNQYLNQVRALVETSPTPPPEQLDSHVDSLTARPIVEAFVDFNDNGRLEEWPTLKDGWTLTTGTILQGPGDTGDLLQTFGYGPEDVDARRENTTVRYRFSDEELERKGINLDNLESPRRAIQMKPSTTWDEALSQLEEHEESVVEEMSPPKRTVRVLDFRLRILENVLYRFETFGSVSKMTDEEAAQYATEDTPTAKDIVEEFRQTGLDECEIWEKKKDLLNWAVREVEPKPSPTTAKRRLKDIGVWVTGKQGVPGSGLEQTIEKLKAYEEAD